MNVNLNNITFASARKLAFGTIFTHRAMKVAWFTQILLFVSLVTEFCNGFLTAESASIGNRLIFRHLNSKRKDKVDDESWLEDGINDLLDERFSSPLKESSNGKANSIFENIRTVFNGEKKWQSINKAIVAGIFIAGIGTGEAQVFYFL